MREDLARALLALEDSLPGSCACPYCGTDLPGWPPLLDELGRTTPPATERRCPACASRVTIDGEPLRLGQWLTGPPAPGEQGYVRLRNTLAPVAAALAAALWESLPGEPSLEILLGVMALAAGAVLAAYGPWREALARRRARRAVVALRRRVGVGDEWLGERLLDGDRRLRLLVRQIRERDGQLHILRDAHRKLLDSSFRERAGAYARAIRLIADQVAAREELLGQLLAYRRDLEALVAVRRAEATFDPGEPLADAAELDAERARLTDALDRLLSAADAELEVSRLTGG